MHRKKIFMRKIIFQSRCYKKLV